MAEQLGKVVSEGEFFKVFFHSGGNGTYSAECYNESKGPFNKQEDALRWVQARLEERMGKVPEPVDVNAQIEGGDADIKAATDQAMQEADKRQEAQEAAAARGEPWRDVGRTDVDELPADGSAPLPGAGLEP